MTTDATPSLRRVVRAIQSKNKSSFERRLRRRWKDARLTTMRSDDGQNLLHIACKNGRLDLIPSLMQRGVSVEEQDEDGCIPAHLAIKWCQTHDVDEFMRRHLEPMMEFSSESRNLLSIKDAYGYSCNDYLDELRDQERRTLNSVPLLEDDDEEKESAEKRFSTLLQEAMENDYRDVYGRYCEVDDVELESSKPETFDEWVERMMREHATQHQRISSAPPRPQRPPDPPQDAPRLGYLKPEVSKDSPCVLTLAEECDKKWEALVNGGNDSISFREVPWPTFIQTLTSKTCDLSSENREQLLKNLQRRWHPDKFNQRFGQRLNAEEAEKIQQRVLEVSQICNDLLSSAH